MKKHLRPCDEHHGNRPTLIVRYDYDPFNGESAVCWVCAIRYSRPVKKVRKVFRSAAARVRWVFETPEPF